MIQIRKGTAASRHFAIPRFCPRPPRVGCPTRSGCVPCRQSDETDRRSWQEYRGRAERRPAAFDRSGTVDQARVVASLPRDRIHQLFGSDRAGLTQCAVGHAPAAGHVAARVPSQSRKWTQTPDMQAPITSARTGPLVAACAVPLSELRSTLCRVFRSETGSLHLE